MKNISIIGSGSWGTALAVTLALEGHKIKIWSFSEEEKDLINKEKKCKFLPNVHIPENVYCTTNIEEAVKDRRHNPTRNSIKIHKRNSKKIQRLHTKPANSNMLKRLRKRNTKNPRRSSRRRNSTNQNSSPIRSKPRRRSLSGNPNSSSSSIKRQSPKRTNPRRIHERKP